jgi:flagellar biosynthetic protein FlhB
MAEEQDRDQKTEAPTQRRLDEARRQGQVASSRELNHAFMFAAATLFAALLGPSLADELGRLLVGFIEAPHRIALADDDLQPVLAALLGGLGQSLLLPTLLFVAAALACGLIQNGLVISSTPLAPKWARISPVAGARRLLSAHSLVEFGKGLLKLVLIGGAGLAVLWPAAAELLGATALDGAGLAVLIQRHSLRLLAVAAAMAGLIALADVLYQRFEHRRQLRMTRQELRDEFKQTEGDPHIKGRLKSLRLARARQRMMAAVPKATVVITNPTHYAVALAYDAAASGAPRLVAKGVDALALRIRALASDHGVPVVENPPLARALHAAVELGAEIPPDHYRAVAEVIGYVMRLRRRG